MSEPQNQKQSPSAMEAPIIFTVRKEKPDVRMFVFDAEYHVHSGVLKAGSGFFATYLNPSGGVAPWSTSPLFHSDWFTAIDKDGTWHLSSDHAYKDTDLTRFKGFRECEKSEFHNLLCALFNRECYITSSKSLEILIGLADYYRALPIVSNSITSSLLDNNGLVPVDPCATLILAYKLRHKALFKDSLMFSLNPYSEPRYKSLKLSWPDLYQVADAVHGRLSKQLDDFWMFFAELAADVGPHGYDDFMEGMKAVQSFYACATDSFAATSSGELALALPKLFRKAYNGLFSAHSLTIRRNEPYKGTDFLLERLEPFIKNNLLLKNELVEEGTFEKYFFCFEIDDKDLPWDLKQIDW